MSVPMAVAHADWPAPVLETIFPAGGRAGTTVAVTVQGKSLDDLTSLRFAPTPDAGATFAVEKTGDKQFAIRIPAELPTGLYDVRTIGRYGISLPRPFFVSRLTESIEAESQEDPTAVQDVPLDCVVNGRMDGVGDVDAFRFRATAGQRVVVECWAERIDSQLHGVLELYDNAGHKLASDRGTHGVDPLIDFVAPRDGDYTVRLFDLAFSGGPKLFYRLDIDTQPRVEFSFPPVVSNEKTTDVRLFGRNLRPAAFLLQSDPGPSTIGSRNGPALDEIFVQYQPSAIDDGLGKVMSCRLTPTQLAAERACFHHPGGQAPVAIGITDLPVILESETNHSPDSAQVVTFPCEIAGRLPEGSEQDWYALEVERGEVLWLEAFGERIGAPLDLDLTLFDAADRREVLHLTDEVAHQGQPGFPANHLDPTGRWVAPSSGRFLLMVRNLIGGASFDPSRVYRISIHREVPTAHVTVQSPLPEQMTAVNLPRGRRAAIDVRVERRRGEIGPLRIIAEDLPVGIECPPVWIGPHVNSAPLIISSRAEAQPVTGALRLSSITSDGKRRPVHGMMLVWPGTRMPEYRVIGEYAVAVTDADFPLSLSATLEPIGFDGKVELRDGDPVVYQGSVIDLLVTVDRRHAEPAVVQLSVVGLPPGMQNQYVTMPAGESQAWLSLEVPATLPAGPYTIAVQGATEISHAEITPGASGKTAIDAVTDPISFYVDEAKIVVEVDPFAPTRIARGEIIQLKYTARRKRGFLGKVHTELVAPGGVVGVRGRGVTFTNNTESGTIQIIANPNAPLGKQQFLRLDAVGTVEDRPTYRGGRFLELEVTE